MRKLLLKLFIKDYNNTQNPKVRSKYGTLSGIVGIISNLILCTLKILAGILSGSVSIVADGINNLSDAGSSIITLIGFKLSSKPADEDHPYGHERIEYLTGVIISFIILFIGISLLTSSFDKIRNPEEMNVSNIVFIILGISIIIKCWLSIFFRLNGKAISSDALLATAQDSLNDCISTGAVILGMIIYKFTDFPIDGYIGLFVSVFIFISGVKMLKETMNPLIGEKISPELEEKIASKVLSYEGILGVHDLVVHTYGPNRVFATIHAEVSSTRDILESHDIIDNIELAFRNELQIDLVIHMDPIDITNPETLALRELVSEIVTSYDQNLSIHDFRVVHGQTHTNVLFDINMPITYPITPKELRKIITERIKEKDEKLNAVIQIDQKYNRNTSDK